MTGLALLLVAPAFGYSGGPPWMQNDRIVPEEGCSCHGAGGLPSTSVVVSISGVPRSYETGTDYEFIISLQHATNSEGGYMLWDYGSGTLTPGDGSLTETDSGGAVSQSAVGNDWAITWTAPSEDVGNVHFNLAGNAVDGDGSFSDGDAWNILPFTINAPGDATNDADPALRTISVGDFQSLFVSEKTAEDIEAEHQAELSATYFEQGNVYFWTTLSILIIAAVIQGEFYERRFGGGPPHLDMSLAMPQGLQRGAVSLGLLIFTGWAVDVNLPWGYTLVIAMCTLWAIYGVYRTVVQARAPQKATDLV